MTRRRLRVLYVQRAIGGGSAQCLLNLVQRLDTDIYEPWVLFHEPSSVAEQLEAIGARIVILERSAGLNQSRLSTGDDEVPNVIRRSRSPKLPGGWIWRDRATIGEVARMIKREAIGLVHHNNNLRANRISILAAKLAGVRQVSHVRFLHERSSIDGWLSRSIDYFIYISQAVEANYRRFGVPSGRGQVVYDPVDVEAYARSSDVAAVRARLGLATDDRVICNIGRIVPWKGQDYFLRAMAEVIRREPRALGLIVGAPNGSRESQEHNTRLRVLAQELQISPRIIFTGFRSDVPDLVAASEVVVHSSSEPEPLGLVIVEAMAGGRPVVATAAGGVTEAVDDRRTGLLVPLRDHRSMAEAVLQLLQNPVRARVMGELAQHSARNQFGIARHVHVVEGIYQHVLNGGGGG